MAVTLGQNGSSDKLWCLSGLSFSPFLICCLFRRPCSLMLYNKCHLYSIMLYANDVLLIAPSVCELEKLLRRCEEELYSVDMPINFKKCSCIRFGSRCNIGCENIVSSTGVAVPCRKELRYLGVTIVNFSYI